MRNSINNYSNVGFVEIDINIDNKYAHTMGYENGAFFDYFLENYGIKTIEDKVFFVKDKESEIYVDETKLTYPAFFENEEIYVPTRAIVEALEGTCEWTKETTKYYCDDYFVTMDNYSNVIIDCSDAEKINTSLKNSFRTYISRSYINFNQLEYIIGEHKNRVYKNIDGRNVRIDD